MAHAGTTEEIEPFNGFPEETLRFLAGLEKHNDRTWFEKHREEYEEFYLKPAQSFIEALGQELQRISQDIEYDPSTRGSGSLMRIYRDVRFSKDKTPYNTALRMIFWEGPLKRTRNPGFYVRVARDGAQVYAGMHGFDKRPLEAFRRAVAADTTGGELEKILAKVDKKKGYESGGAHYKRVPRHIGGQAGKVTEDHPRAALLKYNGLWVLSPVISTKQVLSKGLVRKVFEVCAVSADLHRWLVRNVARS